MSQKKTVQIKITITIKFRINNKNIGPKRKILTTWKVKYIPLNSYELRDLKTNMINSTKAMEKENTIHETYRTQRCPQS